MICMQTRMRLALPITFVCKSVGPVVAFAQFAVHNPVVLVLHALYHLHTCRHVAGFAER